MADRVAEHVARFNAAVRTGEWDDLVAGFAADARLEFVGVPAGPYAGRAAIAAAYRDRPPDDTMSVRRSRTDGAVEVVDFEWTRGGGGVMTLAWTPDGLLERLVVEFA